MTGEMKQTEPRRPAQSNRQLNSVVGYVTGVVAACGIIMWSVFNIWLNVLAFWNRDVAGDQRWWVTGLVVLATCVIPLSIGLWLLLKSLSTVKKP